jgi:hypothetical protein
VELIKFVIPKGFRGAFVVEEDPDAGPAPKDSDGAWVYSIGADGRLRARTVAPFRSWHETIAAYSDGTKIEFSSIGPIEPYKDATVKLRTLFADSDGRHYFLVGTEEELADAAKNRAGLEMGGVAQ